MSLLSEIVISRLLTIYCNLIKGIVRRQYVLRCAVQRNVVKYVRRIVTSVSLTRNEIITVINLDLNIIDRQVLKMCNLHRNLDKTHNQRILFGKFREKTNFTLSIFKSVNFLTYVENLIHFACSFQRPFN